MGYMYYYSINIQIKNITFRKKRYKKNKKNSMRITYMEA